MYFTSLEMKIDECMVSIINLILVLKYLNVVEKKRNDGS